MKGEELTHCVVILEALTLAEIRTSVIYFVCRTTFMMNCMSPERNLQAKDADKVKVLGL